LLPADWQSYDAPLPFELILAVNKMDTLPRVAGHKRIEACIRKRHKQAGMPALAAVHLVSSTRKIGIPRLLEDLVERVRPLHALLVPTLQQDWVCLLVSQQH
jgi:GTP-binding protein EngB required for normal cell division